MCGNQAVLASVSLPCYNTLTSVSMIGMRKHGDDRKMTNTKGNEIQKSSASLIVFAESGADMEEAALLAKRLNAGMTQNKSDAEQADLMLRLDADGLSLIGGELVLRGDFTRMLPLLAAAGFSVRLYEYDPVIAALLRDTLRRAAELPELAEIVGRMQLFEEDSLTALPQLPAAPDVILLDPMFPERQKSALIKKKFQLLQKLERPCGDETALVNAAITAHPRKVVIKRPLKGPYLANRKPSYSLNGKAIRYDCLVLP